MKLMTKAIENKFARLGRQEAAGDDAIVVAKFFTPWANWTWYATEYEPEDRIFFGLVDGNYRELGYFSRDELEQVRGPVGLKIERDKHYSGKMTVGEVMSILDQGGHV